jgi:hypothetical protein
MYTYTYIHTCDSSLSSGVSLRSLPTLDNDLTGPTMEDGLAGGVNLSNGGVPFEEHTATHSSRPRPTRCATPPPPRDPTAPRIAIPSQVHTPVRAPLVYRRRSSRRRILCIEFVQ